MKKFLTTLLILSGVYSVSFAQTKGAVNFGANVGFNSSSVESSQSGQSSNYTGGFNVGGYLEYYFSDRWSIKGKVTYDQKGWGNGYLIDNNGNEVDGINFHLNYLTIPIMANWHFGRTRNWYLNFGPYVGVLLNANESSNSGLDVKSAFNTTDVGLDLGIGVKIPITNKVKLFFEYDGQAGATTLFKQSEGDNVQSIRSSFNAGLAFSLN